jgi:hypothetical protein
VRPDIDEALRYLGAGAGAPEQLRQTVQTVADHLSAQIQPRTTFQVFDLEARDGGYALSGTAVVLTGKSAKTMLSQCQQAVLLACTLGAQFDALLRTQQVRDMAQAVILDACGSALVEQGCNAAEEELKGRFPNLFLTDRFSPGYGDLPLNLQPSICAALDTARRIGLHVTDSLLLNPGKSVTAVIGLSDRPQMARIRGCAFCAMRERCTLRKGGKTCGM